MRTPQRKPSPVVRFPKGSAPKLRAAVRDALAERRRRRLVLDGHVRLGLDQPVEPQGQPELVATASDRMPYTLLDGGEPVANGSLVDLEQGAGRGCILPQAEVGTQRLTQPSGPGVRGRQRAKLACDELPREALILDDQRLERDIVIPGNGRAADHRDPVGLERLPVSLDKPVLPEGHIAAGQKRSFLR